MGALALKRRAYFRLLAHTADIGLEAHAPDCERLFVAAARGFKRVVYGTSPARPALRRDVRLTAGDRPELLVVWLNEILFLGEAEQLVPATFKIVELTTQNLVATIFGECFDPARHAIERSAKAVTYHHLVVEEREAGWYARVYIDL